MPSYQADYALFEAADAQVLGVSIDSIPSHRAFAKSLGGIDKYPLLADFHPKGEMARAYGVYKEDSGYTERAIYVAVVGYEENPAEMTARYSERDSDAYLDDCAEVFFDTNLDQQSFYQVVANTIGGIVDVHVLSPKNSDEEEARKWNGEQRIATRVASDRWIFEMEMPFSSLGGTQVQSGDLWGFNVARVRISFGACRRLSN